MKNNFQNREVTRPENISRSIYFIIISAHGFEDFICTNQPEFFFLGLGPLFQNVKPLIWGQVFVPKLFQV